MQATFTGQEYDEENELQYYGARYLDNDVGRFLSIDPATLVLHDGQELKKITKGELEQILANPQNLNSYAYAVNNPVIMKDADGNFAFLFVAAVYAAPYVVPAALTAVASVGAWWQVQELGQAIGYMSEGDDASAQQHFDSMAEAQALTGAAAASLLAADGLMSSTKQDKSIAGQNISKNLHQKLKGGDLLPTQNYVNSKQVDKYYNDLMNGKTLRPIEVMNNNGNKYILDGHHRYVASQRAGVEIQRVEMSGPLSGTDWDSVRFE